MEANYSNVPQDQYIRERLRLAWRAACALSDAINARPYLDGTTPARELEELLVGNAPFDYLDDIEARVLSAPIEETRVLFRLATCDAEEFPDLWHSAAKHYRLPDGAPPARPRPEPQCPEFEIEATRDRDGNLEWYAAGNVELNGEEVRVRFACCSHEDAVDLCDAINQHADRCEVM